MSRELLSDDLLSTIEQDLLNKVGVFNDSDALDLIADCRSLKSLVRELAEALSEIKEHMGGDHLDGWDSPEDVWKIAVAALAKVKEARI